MADSTEPKPKTKSLSEEQKLRMREALAAKRADPVWQAEQKKKREERKAAKAAAATLVEMKEEKPKKEKKSKKATEKTEKKPSAWDKLTPEQKAERLAKMQAGKQAKKKEKTD